MDKGGSKLLAIEPNFDLSRLNEIPEDIREAIERHISSQSDQIDELKSNYERLRVDSGERRLKSELRNYFANCTLSYEIYVMIFKYASKHNDTLCHGFMSRETSAFEVGSSHMLWAIIDTLRRGSVRVRLASRGRIHRSTTEKYSARFSNYQLWWVRLRVLVVVMVWVRVTVGARVMVGVEAR